MYPFRTFFVRDHHLACLFDGERPRELLPSGLHWRFDPKRRLKMFALNTRDPWHRGEDLDILRASGLLDARATWVDLAQHERALLWSDGRFLGIAGPGLHLLWTGMHDLTVERHDVRHPRLEHAQLPAVVQAPGTDIELENVLVPRDHCALAFVDGEARGRLEAGRHAFWKAAGEITVETIDLRERILELTSQEMLTRDRVSLRINLDLTYRIVDPELMLKAAHDASHALYREAQMSLRERVGRHPLEELLTEKSTMSQTIPEAIQSKAEALGMRVMRVGIRDIILPGDIRALLNKVLEAQKNAEAAMVLRREEVAAMRSRANAARMLDDNPSLLRLRELELIEALAERGQLNISLDERGLRERIVNMI